ncbi:hypothetical protein [Ascidiimonas aurantiaca]|uniref:hypothetical protein n=1 Tax=Ascidiimonas aurantiaca TaxID=1685432 RepID=UPI0030EF639E
MRKINKIVALGLSALALSCSNDDNAIDKLFENTTRGAILRTVEITSGTFNVFDESSEFIVTLEEQDTQNGGLLESVDVLVTFIDNNDADGTDFSKDEVMLTTLEASAFSEGPFGLPRATYSISLEEVKNAVGLSTGQFFGGDRFNFRFVLNLTDGRSFSFADAAGTVQSGSFFRSPFRYGVDIKCVPTAPVPGDYELTIEDSFGDGWDGAFITVTIDGVSTDYTIEDGSVGVFTINVPPGTTSLTFTYTPGSFEDEHSYVLIAPTGETAAADGPGPTPGEIVLNICNG